MIVGCVPDPEGWERWEEARAYLEPARELGGHAEVIEPGEVLWVAMDGDEMLAAATTWLSVDGYVEFKLVGGKDIFRWLDLGIERIGSAARDAGASRLQGIGRRGWGKALRARGWGQYSTGGKLWLFEKEL